MIPDFQTLEQARAFLVARGVRGAETAETEALWSMVSAARFVDPDFQREMKAELEARQTARGYSPAHQTQRNAQPQAQKPAADGNHGWNNVIATMNSERSPASAKAPPAQTNAAGARPWREVLSAMGRLKKSE
jgi:hypothetical protein